MPIIPATGLGVVTDWYKDNGKYDISKTYSSNVLGNVVDKSLENSKFNTISPVVREFIINTYDRYYESKMGKKMNLNDFIKILKISILIDLGMYSMAFIKNRFDFHNVDVLNILNSFPLVFIFCVFIFYLKKVIRELSFFENSGSLKR